MIKIKKATISTWPRNITKTNTTRKYEHNKITIIFIEKRDSVSTLKQTKKSSTQKIKNIYIKHGIFEQNRYKEHVTETNVL